MQCEHCNQRPAAIHLTQIVDNEVKTTHLCEQCAHEKGVQTGATVAKFPLSDFLASMGQGPASTIPADQADSISCAFCQSTLQDFRQSGRLGCSECYQSFEGHLRDLLRRLHGSSQHVGEIYLTPATEGVPMDSRTITDLREQLKRAIETENFELAAELRDRIRILE